jgi:hypothetical protein
VIGQDEIVAILKAYVANPEPTAFILCGSTGCGKGSAASALCNELGADPYWGVQDIPAGKQTAEAVDEMTRTLWQHCPAGSGWKVVIVNECDQMHPKVNARWCDILENIPPKVCIIFTTNKIAEMTKDDEGRRFVDRCHRLDFRSDWAILDSAQPLINRIWAASVNHNHVPRAADLVSSGGFGGQVSFRRIVNALHDRIMRLPASERILPVDPPKPQAQPAAEPEVAMDAPAIPDAPESQPLPCEPLPEVKPEPAPVYVAPTPVWPEWKLQPCWYVTVTDGPRTALVCGPFAEAGQAAARRNRPRKDRAERTVNNAQNLQSH